MELIVKLFRELTLDELVDIYKLRTAVFVVEHNCPYQEVDEADRVSYHLILKDGDGIEAYARVIPQGVLYEACSIGRIIAVKRRCGLGTRIVDAAIRVAKEKLGADKITIKAQSYACPLYIKFGFKQSSEEFIEDGIPHMLMDLEL